MDTGAFYSLNKDNGKICFLDPLQEILPNTHKNAALPGPLVAWGLSKPGKDAYILPELENLKKSLPVSKGANRQQKPSPLGIKKMTCMFQNKLKEGGYIRPWPCPFALLSFSFLTEFLPSKSMASKLSGSGVWGRWGGELKLQFPSLCLGGSHKHSNAQLSCSALVLRWCLSEQPWHLQTKQ